MVPTIYINGLKLFFISSPPYCRMTWAGHAWDMDRYEGADLNKNSYEGGRKSESWSGDKSLD